MSIHVDLHDFIGATANVYPVTLDGKRKWFCVIKLDHLQLFTGNFNSKVEALMGAFEYVDTLKAAVQKCADDEGMRDLQDSVNALPVELVTSPRGPDGPVADTSDGYGLTAEDREEINKEAGNG